MTRRVAEVAIEEGRHARVVDAGREPAELAARLVSRLLGGRPELAPEIEALLGARPAPPEPRVAFAGGRTAAALYVALAVQRPAERPPWHQIRFFLADERAVPPGHGDRNDRLLRERLLAPLAIPFDRIQRMEAEAPDLDVAARRYDKLLETPLDLVVLGLGEDGHIASLFPRSPLLAGRDGPRVQAVTASPKPPAERLTLTPRALLEARETLVIADGEGKRAALRAALAPGPAAEIPARVLRGAIWVCGNMTDPLAGL